MALTLEEKNELRKAAGLPLLEASRRDRWMQSQRGPSDRDKQLEDALDKAWRYYEAERDNGYTWSFTDFVLDADGSESVVDLETHQYETAVERSGGKQEGDSGFDPGRLDDELEAVGEEQTDRMDKYQREKEGGDI